MLATLQCIAPKLKSDTLKEAVGMLTQQFKMQNPDIMDQQIKLCACNNVDQAFVTFRCQQILGNDGRILGIGDL